jgi:hypothetical protein
MDKPVSSDLFSTFLESSRLKSSFEVCKIEYFKAMRSDKTDSSRRRGNSLNSIDETAQPTQPPAPGQPPAENGPRDVDRSVASQQLKTAKPLIVPVLSFLFSKINMNSVFKKILFKLQPGKDAFIIELEGPENDPRIPVPRAKIEINFNDTLTIGFSKEDDQISLEFKKFDLVKDSKKKMTPWMPCRLEELLGSREPIALPEVKTCVLKIPKDSFIKIHHPKARITEKLRQFGVTVKENQRLLQKTGARSDTTILPIKEIISATELEDLKKRENTLANADKQKKLEAFKQIELPRLSEANSKAKVCPVYSCFQPFPTVAALKTHISQQHPELSANGMEIDNNGAITYPDHIFDSVLMTVKIFPNFVSSYVLEEGKKLASVQEKADGNKN